MRTWATSSADRSKEEQVWDWLAERATFARQGRRVTKPRFQAVVAAMQDHIPYWHIDLFERVYVALEGLFEGQELPETVGREARPR